MLIDDAKKFNLVVPNYDGSAHLKRCLAYLDEVNYRGLIVIADSSHEQQRKFVKSCPETYPNLKLQILYFEPETRYIDKVHLTLESLEAQYVMVGANDDFVIPEAIERMTNFLDAHPEYSSARGRVPMFHLGRIKGAGGNSEIQLTLLTYPMRSYEQDDASERLLAHIRNFATTLNSIHRRENFTFCCRYTIEHTKNTIFEQYLSSAMAAVQGKILCSDEVYYVRQGHANSVAAKMKQGDYEHWPMLFASPHYSRYYLEFRGALCEYLGPQSQFGAERLGKEIDDAYIYLLRRSFCGKEPLNPQEAKFQEKLKSSKTPEHELFMRCVNFTVRYPDTF